jgi:hypothetical protein
LSFLAGGGGFALLVPHRRIVTVQGQKFGVAATLDDLAMIQDQDLVGIDHSGQAVGDHQRGPVA